MERQEEKDMGAIYRFGPYKLSDCYRKFEVNFVQWHSMDPKLK